MEICVKEDVWLREKFEQHTRWIVTLSNGLVVYDDSGRPGKSENAWFRLYDYCAANAAFVVSMRLQFRSHIEGVGENSDGFYLGRGLYGGLGGFKCTIIAGTLNDGSLKVSKWQIPELIKVPFIDDQLEQVRSTEKVGKHLICKKNTLLPPQTNLVPQHS